jgi:hypothetical protein
MINSNERIFQGSQNICGGVYGGVNCPRVNSQRNNNFYETQDFCTYSRNNFYSPEVRCYTSEVDENLNKFNMPNFTVNLSNFRVRFENIDDLIGDVSK